MVIPGGITAPLAVQVWAVHRKKVLRMETDSGFVTLKDLAASF
jgi:hypothetical protein